MKKMSCQNCQEDCRDRDACNFLRGCYRLVHYMYVIHRSPLHTWMQRSVPRGLADKMAFDVVEMGVKVTDSVALWSLRVRAIFRAEVHAFANGAKGWGSGCFCWFE